MGNSLDKLGGFGSQETEESPEEPSTLKDRKRKSKGSPEDSPTKVTKLDTAKYVYERLFLQGESADIRIHALGSSWNLHKLYLQQCAFFEALLGGSWGDSNSTELHLSIPDENVSVDGLHAVFASLYNNEIEYSVDNVLSIIAAASFFKLESVLVRCDEELVEHISESNVVRFLNMTKMYGLKTLRKECMQQLKQNFWRLMKNYALLAELEKDDFLLLLSSPDLLLVEGEVDLYRMVKNWIYIRNTDNFAFSDEETLTSKVKEFLKESADPDLFLENASLFAALRLHHLVTSTGGINELEDDSLVPKEILRALMVDSWKATMLNEENPTAGATIADEDFYLNCFRGGKRVEESPRCWRWIGYNNGMDMILNYNRGIITLKRNCFHTATPYSVNLKTDRIIHYRLIVCHGDGRPLFDSGRKELTMHLDQSSIVCRLPDDVSLPLSVHLFYLATSPPPPTLLYINQFLKSRLSQIV